MPRRMTSTKKGTHQTLKNCSFESLAVHWLMQDGWQVFLPILDNGHQTDILISDGPKYYRVQVKTVEATGHEHPLENKWEGSNVSVVIVFARNSTWGYVMPAFKDKEKSLNAPGHIKFHSEKKKEFIKAFHTVELYD